MAPGYLWPLFIVVPLFSVVAPGYLWPLFIAVALLYCSVVAPGYLWSLFNVAAPVQSYEPCLKLWPLCLLLLPQSYCCGPCLQEMKLIGILSDQRNLFI